MFFFSVVFAVISLFIVVALGMLVKPKEKEAPVYWAMLAALAFLLSFISYKMFVLEDKQSKIAAADQIVGSETRDVEVVSVRRPKHYYVEFKEIETGRTVNQYISKHCNTHNQIQPGQRYKLAVSIHHNPLKTPQDYAVYVDVNNVFCPSAK